MESTTNGGEMHRSIVNRTKSAYKSSELLLTAFRSKESIMLLAEYCKQNSGSSKYHGNIHKTALRVFG